jgi:hypothetical protein
MCGVEMLYEPETVPEFDSVAICHCARESQCFIVCGSLQAFSPSDVALKVDKLHAVTGRSR